MIAIYWTRLGPSVLKCYGNAIRDLHKCTLLWELLCEYNGDLEILHEPRESRSWVVWWAFCCLVACLLPVVDLRGKYRYVRQEPNVSNAGSCVSGRVRVSVECALPR